MTVTKTVTAILSNKTAGTSASTTLSDCATIDTTELQMDLSIIVSCTLNASCTAGARVKAFASNDDSTWTATHPYWQGDIAWISGGGAVLAGFDVPHGPKYLKFQVTNLDTAQTITAIYINKHQQAP
jgi:hypothetical protein